MDSNFDQSTGKYTVSTEFKQEFKLPNGATLAQLAEFDAVVRGVKITPMIAISQSYERIFDDQIEEEEQKPFEMVG